MQNTLFVSETTHYRTVFKKKNNKKKYNRAKKTKKKNLCHADTSLTNTLCRAPRPIPYRGKTRQPELKPVGHDFPSLFCAFIVRSRDHLWTIPWSHSLLIVSFFVSLSLQTWMTPTVRATQTPWARSFSTSCQTKVGGGEWMNERMHVTLNQPVVLTVSRVREDEREVRLGHCVESWGFKAAF